LPAAGEFAYAGIVEYPGYGLEFYGGEEPDVGDWFIIDYNAIGIGDRDVAFYDYSTSTTIPVCTLVLHQVPTRDFNKDTKVDFSDFAMLASYWQETDCGSIDDCEGTDLDTNGNVDLEDLRLFALFWLEKTE
jgi:hypothetical protein